jgi:hypothetical protein
MKYKLKFEIVYPNIGLNMWKEGMPLDDKGIMRDMTLQLILSNTDMEVESDHPISTPSKEDIIILGDTEYVINRIKHKVDKDLYLTIIEVENSEIKKIKAEKKEMLFNSGEGLASYYKNLSI